MAEAGAPLHITAFSKDRHERSGFSCGHTAIDSYFKHSISAAIKGNLVSVFVASEDASRLCPALGFYALNMHSIDPEDLPELAGRARVVPIPAIYLKALAVDRRHQGRKLGSALMVDAIKRCVLAAEQVAAAAIVLDVLGGEGFERRVGFYESLGFGIVGGRRNEGRMVLAMKVAKEALR